MYMQILSNHNILQSIMAPTRHNHGMLGTKVFFTVKQEWTNDEMRWHCEQMKMDEGQYNGKQYVPLSK